MCVCTYSKRPEEEARFSRAIVTGGFELPAGGARSQTQVLLMAESALTH